MKSERELRFKVPEKLCPMHGWYTEHVKHKIGCLECLWEKEKIERLDKKVNSIIDYLKRTRREQDE